MVASYIWNIVLLLRELVLMPPHHRNRPLGYCGCFVAWELNVADWTTLIGRNVGVADRIMTVIDDEVFNKYRTVCVSAVQSQATIVWAH